MFSDQPTSPPVAEPRPTSPLLTILDTIALLTDIGAIILGIVFAVSVANSDITIEIIIAFPALLLLEFAAHLATKHLHRRATRRAAT